MTEKPLISVIVPVYNTEAYVRQCVDSLIGQTYDNLEIILVEDGCTDGSPAICDEYARRDSRIRVIHQAHMGPSGARNVALDICTGEYIAFVDSDDWIRPETYEILLGAAQAQDLDIVFCTANIIVDGRVVENRFRFFEDQTIMPPEQVLEYVLRDEVTAHVWLRLWRRCCWENVRFPEGRYYEDLAIIFYAHANAKKNVGFLACPLYNYRMNPNGISLQRNATKGHHIFLALRAHYEYARQNCPGAVETTLRKTASEGVGAYNCLIAERDPADRGEQVAEIKSFLAENRKEILKLKNLKRSKKCGVRLLLWAEPVYRGLYLLYYRLFVKKKRS